MSFYEQVRNTYGLDVCTNLKNYSRLGVSHTKNKNSLVFLLKCREFGLIPEFIQNSTQNVSTIFDFGNEDFERGLKRKLASTQSKYQSKLLNISISLKQSQIKKQKRLIGILESKIKNRILENEYNYFFRSQEQTMSKINDSTKLSHKRKLELLKLKVKHEMRIHFNENWFVNKTQVEFPEDTKWLLSLGPKFALPMHKDNLPIFKIIADGEELIKTKDQNEQEPSRSCFTKILQNYMRFNSMPNFDKYLNKIFVDTKRFLKRHPEIYIVPADKGNVTVAMLKINYIDKMNEMMTDRNTYTVLRNDPTNKVQNKNNNIVKDLFRNNLINETEKKYMTTYTANSPKIYGLPKIHKQNVPLRPICSSLKVPCYELSKYMVKILNNITISSKYNVKNASSFISTVSPIILEEDNILVSFDATSLFTNIPIPLVLELVEKSWDVIKEHTRIPKLKFLEILRFCIIDNNYLEFNKIFYQQKQGVPMGSPASPILADIVMEALLDNVFDNVNNPYKPKIVTKYVDDIFVILKSSHVNSTLTALNSFHPKIQFTVEFENNGKIPYLDVLVIRQNNRLIFDWYKKPTSSGRLINYNSKQPKQMIINTAKNFISRVLDISNIVFRQKNIKVIMDTLISNSFPQNLIRTLLNQYFNPMLRTNLVTNAQQFSYKSILYIQNLSNRILNAPIRNKDNVRIAFKSANVLRTSLFSNLKGAFSKEDKSNIVYKINCLGDGTSNCPSVYVGTSMQKLKNRISGHRSDINNRHSQKTALAQHCIDEGHRPDFTNVEILQTETNYNKRMLLEMLHILDTENTVNRRSDCEGLSSIYSQFIIRDYNN